MKIADNLYLIKGGRGANSGLFIGDNGVLVIDSKMDQASATAIFKKIRELTDLPLLYLVNTHSDGDHTSGNRYFPRSIKIIAHANCRKELFLPGRDGAPSAWQEYPLSHYLPSITFQDKMELYLGGSKMELWYFGVGHTTGDAVVYFPREKIAFLGDLIFLNRPQLIHAYKGGNSFSYVETLGKMLETLPARVFCSGHADPVGRKDVETCLADMKKRQEKIRSLMAAGKDLPAILEQFPQEEGNLVTIIHDEITRGY